MDIRIIRVNLAGIETASRDGGALVATLDYTITRSSGSPQEEGILRSCVINEFGKGFYAERHIVILEGTKTYRMTIVMQNAGSRLRREKPHLCMVYCMAHIGGMTTEYPPFQIDLAQNTTAEE